LKGERSGDRAPRQIHRHLSSVHSKQ